MTPAADEGPPPVRRIVHVDMDAFFASVEQRDNPALRGLPVAVGGVQERGVVAAASYEARRFGVRSAMPSMRARRLCPELIFVKPRFDAYRAISQQIRSIFARFTPQIEPLALDEAYLDLTDHLRPGQTATSVAKEIRAMIRAETSLTASAGVSYNKFLAKLASDHRKPDGLFVIPPEAGPDFVLDLPIGRFHGVGPATARRMEALGIRTGADLRAQPLELLVARFGKSGQYYWNVARGIDHRQVRPNRIRKSIGAETTYFENLTSRQEVLDALAPLAEKVWRHLKNGIVGRTVTVKIRYGDFRQITRARTLTHPVRDLDELLLTGRDLAAPVAADGRGVRLLGITLSSLSSPSEDLPPPAQLDLFG